ncbi:MAG: CAP domain-containing protein, partial [Actinomycetota bacterium]|nr:CAP domain-containing protein [Actinomycetota bacterium]
AIKPERADAVPTITRTTCDGGTIALDVEENRIVHFQNQARISSGLEPLCVDPILTEAARGHSADMIARNYFGHGMVGARLTSYGYNWLTYGENIAGGYGAYYSSGDHAMQMWMASPGHHANIMNPNFQEVGVGKATGEYNGIANYTLYTVDFAAPAY